jgi:type VI protein secretion system component VasK
MSAFPILLADETTDAALRSWRMSDPGTRERLLIFGALGLVTLLILAWAVFLRKGRRRRHELHHSHQHSSKPAEVAQARAEEDVPPPSGKRRRRRRSGHSHRPRNPTLAETGGLPPIRLESPPESEP